MGTVLAEYKCVRPGVLAVSVVAPSSDAATAQAAQAKIAEIREQVAQEFPMTMQSAHAGEVIGSA